MDKLIIKHDEIDHRKVSIHAMPRGIRDFHRRYGLWICRFGHNRNLPYEGPVEPRYFEFCCISHLLEGKGFLWDEKHGTRVFEAGTAVFMTPRHIHLYGGYHAHYLEDTICFTGPVMDLLIQSGVFKNGLSKMGKGRRLLPIIEQAIDPAEDSQLAANIALQKLIVDVYLENRKVRSTEKMNVFEELTKEIHENPRKWWSIAEMADFCNLSEIHFRRTFKTITGMSPKNYVDRFKIQKAIEKLSSFDDPIATIAESLGYQDPFHFSRRFKQMTGYSPEIYRKNFQ